MKKYSFIDYGKEDFLRDSEGNVIKIPAKSDTEAAKWLAEHGEKNGWTNKGTYYWVWEQHTTIVMYWTQEEDRKIRHEEDNVIDSIGENP